MEPMESILLMPSQAAGVAGISRETLLRKVKTGQGPPSVGEGRNRRFPLVELLAWNAARAKAGAAVSP